MQEISLSSDLTTLTTEIKSYQSIGGQAIFEIGRRLKWVKENDLAHGEYLKWLSSIHMDRTQASRFIKIVSELPNDGTYQHLGMRVLSEIATMPESERDKPQQLPSGEIKKPDEMTVRELRETKKQLKQSNEELDKLRNQPPKVVEKEIHIKDVPDDYDYLKGIVENTKSINERYERENKQLRKELENSNNDVQDNSELIVEKKKLEREISSLNRVRNLHQEINDFLTSVASSNYVSDFKTLSNQSDALNTMVASITGLEKWCRDTKEKLKKQNFIEGDISHE
ncbi:DUF3102 domain-containing protein [Levilactobacillus enshiensis]|uniref:DUF3102 domain-containing protein n=1 Tax=Levilactobacillus enshiensis TaxID=2590213 RepID=UPI00117B637E|nr:DUF3102 domain-containing protein [Levilactobacillus enshiensis]